MSLNPPEIIGSRYSKANKSHVCWTCSEKIKPSDYYWRMFGRYNARFFTIKHCRKTCEITAEIIEKNPQVWHKLHSEVMK